MIADSNQFCRTFEKYSYLWLDERDGVLDSFLTYGKILSPEEMDRIGSEDLDLPPPVPRKPTMNAFREQIDKYEDLYLEIEEIEPYKVFNCWFQVYSIIGVTPFM